MKRTFSYKGEDWEVETTGQAMSAGFISSRSTSVSRVSRWTVMFRAVTDPKRAVRGSIGVENLDAVPVPQLIHELERALSAHWPSGRGRDPS